MKWCVAVTLLLLLPFFSSVAEENSETHNKEKTRIFSKILSTSSNVRTISSDFSQERRTSMLTQPVTSRGRFYYEKPDRLRWEITQPEPSGFMIDGEIARRWKGHDTPPQTFELRKEASMKVIVDQVFAWTKGDIEWIERRYRTTVVHASPAILKLIPLSSQEKKYLDYFLIIFDEGTFHVDTVEIHERGDDSIRIRFFNRVINEPLNRGLFS